MSKHNYSQYSKQNNKHKSDRNTGTVGQAATNYNKPKTEKTVVTSEFVTATITEEPAVTVTRDPEIKMAVETVDTVALPKTVTGIVVNCIKLNVRANPSIDAEVVTIIGSNSEIEIDPAKSTNTWLKIATAAGVEGYCMRKFVDINV